MNNRRSRVLFLCTGNSCRSQMAEGWARHLALAGILPFSAGTVAKGLDQRAVKVMAEAGVDIAHQQSKTLEDLTETVFDYVITLCGHAHETCPVFPGATHVMHRGFDDPPELAKGLASEADALGHYRRVRDEIRRFVEELTELVQKAAIAPAEDAGS